jgi:uncharacterized protein (TIGR00269 family)
MNCSCGNHAVFESLCREHFLLQFEEKVWDTIREYGLIGEQDRIAVAVSGGKDSMTILTLLHKRFSVTALAVDEGIAGYRDKTLEDVRQICKERNIPLVIKSYKELVGFTLDEMMAKRKFHPCTVCGTFRRHLLNIMAKNFDVLATGHNADDEAQAVLMNVIKGNTELFSRLGPISGNGAKGFTRRVKPLYFCTEKEIMTYAYLNGLVREFSECPNVHESYRHLIRDLLNDYSVKHKGVKLQVLKNFLAYKKHIPVLDTQLAACERCGEPASGNICKTCQYIGMIQS